MLLIQAIILGIVQGIGEFLPISSSAHLILVPYLLNFNLELNNSAQLAFDVSLHFGTLIAVLLVFYRDWLNLVNGAYQNIIHKKNTFEGKMFLYLVYATIPGALIGKLLENYIEVYFRNMILAIAILLAIMGALICLGDKWSEKHYKKPKNFNELNFKETFIIGLSQALAIFPGFSRSGTTMLTARILGINRQAAAKFSFLLSAPIIFGATMLKFNDLINNFSLNIFIGIFTSAIVGFISIKFLLNYIKKHDFSIFAYYRFLIAAIVIIKFIIN